MIMLFGISPVGWVHTLGSLPAVPAAAYMFVRSGRIVPRSPSGTVYLFSMLIGAVTIFLIAHESVSYVIAVGTLLLLLAGYGVARLPQLGRAAKYIETISLTLSTFLLLVPSIKETLTRVPDGHPLVTSPKSPVLVGALGAVFVLTIVALIAQIVRLRKAGGISAGRAASAYF
jgi:multisubunit Na+/H+ antiporter MnhG subunit